MSFSAFALAAAEVTVPVNTARASVMVTVIEVRSGSSLSRFEASF